MSIISALELDALYDKIADLENQVKESSLKNYIINLVAGDWSDDGHGKTSTMTLKSNITGQEFQDALIQAIGLFNLPAKGHTSHQLDLCSAYEESTIHDPEYIEALGLELVDDQEEAYINSDDSPYPEDQANNWFYIMIRLVQKIRPGFEFEVLKPDSTVYIGGYGLFY